MGIVPRFFAREFPDEPAADVFDEPKAEQIDEQEGEAEADDHDRRAHQAAVARRQPLEQPHDEEADREDVREADHFIRCRARRDARHGCHLPQHPQLDGPRLGGTRVCNAVPGAQG